MPTSIERKLKKLEADFGVCKCKLEMLDISVKRLSSEVKILYESRSQTRTVEDSLNYTQAGVVFILGLILGAFLAGLLI